MVAKKKSLTHKKRRIEVRGVEKGGGASLAEPGEASGLYIDGDFVPTVRRSSGGFWTHRLPYEEFDSLADLGKALVDYQEI